MCYCSTCVFREADAEWRLFDLLCKQILLIEEEDNGGVDEELVVANGVEQHQRLVHAILQRERERDGKDGEPMREKKKIEGKWV